MTPWRNVDEDHFLKGKFFLSFVEIDGKRQTQWQGKILSVDYISTDKPLVASCQLFSWMDGMPTCIVLVDATEMVSKEHIATYKFYRSEEEWNFAATKDAV